MHFTSPPDEKCGLDTTSILKGASTAGADEGSLDGMGSQTTLAADSVELDEKCSVPSARISNPGGGRGSSLSNHAK
jgi:hypothetical protein